MTAPVRWGFLGAGGISRSVASAVHSSPSCVLQAVGARSSDRAAALEPAAAYGSYSEVVEDPAVEAVYIGLGNDQHLPWALRALEAGKAVLCEKPLVLSAAEVDELSAAAGNGLLVEATWYRWHPRTREAERLVSSGAIGAVRSVTSMFSFAGGLDPGNYRYDPAMGGGALYDVGCYAVSAALWAYGGSVPDEVSARSVYGPTGVDLLTEAVLDFPSGSAAVTAGFEGPVGQHVVIQGDLGEVELRSPAFAVRDEPAQLWVSDGRTTRHEEFPAVDPYRLMFEAVSARVRGEDAWVVPLSESRAVASTLDAIRAAAGETARS